MAVERKWRPSNVEVPDRVVEAMDRALTGLPVGREHRLESLRLGLQAALQEWAGDRPRWTMNTSAERHVLWLENRVKELEAAQCEVNGLVSRLRDVLD